MTDVIFSEETTPEKQPDTPLFEQEETDSREVSKEWLQAAKEFLGKSLEYNTLEQIDQYQEDNQVQHEHPTTHELAKYMGRSYSSIQPRTSELKDRMLITEAGKRPCTCKKCKRAREEKGKPEISVTTWKIREVRQ
jgi:hypothetical protein